MEYAPDLPETLPSWSTLVVHCTWPHRVSKQSVRTDWRLLGAWQLVQPYLWNTRHDPDQMTIQYSKKYNIRLHLGLITSRLVLKVKNTQSNACLNNFNFALIMFMSSKHPLWSSFHSFECSIISFTGNYCISSPWQELLNTGNNMQPAASQPPASPAPHLRFLTGYWSPVAMFWWQQEECISFIQSQFRLSQSVCLATVRNVVINIIILHYHIPYTVAISLCM